jgi:adenylate kinase
MNVKPDRSAWLYGPDSECQVLPRNVLHPRRLVLLGAPGVGKGTQAELLGCAYGACHLSTGDIFRAVGTRCGTPPSPAMKEALTQMHRGRLVADDTVLALVRERLHCLNCRGGFVLDGFPRTVAQAEALDALFEKQGITLDAVVDYEVPHDKIIARLSGRRTCPACKAVFHVDLHPPRQAGLCDECGTALVQREDDRPAAVGVRLSVYQKATAPLVEYYWATGMLITVHADGTPEEILERTVRLLASRRPVHQD